MVLMPDKMLRMSVAVAVGLAAIIGAGIFVLSGTAIALAGPFSLLAFVLVGIVALLVAVELGILGSVMPKANGASYSFVYGAFGSELGFITGILLYFSFATAVSAVSIGFGSYLASLLGIRVSSFSIPFAVGLIFVLSLLNIIGMKKAAKSDFWLVAIKVSILVVFIAFAIVFALLHPSFIAGHFSSKPSQYSIGAIFAASVAIFFAYTGFQAISSLTDRIEGGARKAARAIVYSVVISLVLYVLVDLALMFLAPASSFTINADPLTFALKSASAPGWLLILVGIGALIATTSAAIAMLLSSSRLFYQIGENHLLPKIARRYNSKTDVAVNGVIISAVIAVVFLFAGNIYIIAAISNFGLLFSYVLTSFAIVHYKRDMRESLHVPFYPYLPAVTVIGLVMLMIGMPREALVIGAAMIMMLLAIYYLLREINNKKVVRIKLFR